MTTVHPVTGIGHTVSKAPKRAFGMERCPICRIEYCEADLGSRARHNIVHERWMCGVTELNYSPDAESRRELKKKLGFQLMYSDSSIEKDVGAELILRAYFDCSLEHALQRGYHAQHPSFAEYVRMRMMEFSGEVLDALYVRYGAPAYSGQLHGDPVWTPERIN